MNHNADCSTSSASSSSDISANLAALGVNLSQQQQQQQQQANSNAKNKKLFPKKLWDLINNEKYYFCLRWSDDGQLVYLNRDEFEDSYLKTSENQFHTQKAISFVRQMNMYGFRKVDDCYYENDNFKRDCEHLLKNMIRKHPNKNHHQQQQQHLIRQHHQQQQHATTHLNEQQHHHQHLIPKQILPPAQRTPQQPHSLLNHNAVGGQPPSQSSPLPATSADPLTGTETGSAADLRTFYALLSSLSGNLYANQLPSQSPPQNYHSALFDTSKAPLVATSFPQQIYQSLLAQQQQQQLDISNCGSPLHFDQTNTTTKDLFTHAPNWSSTTCMTSSQSLRDRVTSATSLLVPTSNVDKSNTSNNLANDLSIKKLRNTPGDNSSSSPLLQQAAGEALPISFATNKRRDHKSVRSLKRGANSMLNSNDRTTANNSNSSLESPSKRNKTMELYHLGNTSTPMADSRQTRAASFAGVNELAKSLVSEIALSRDAHLDSNVLLEASKYTEGFVQTLFDTALVIARHSNGLNLSDYMLNQTTPTTTTASDTSSSPQRLPNTASVHDEDELDEDEDDSLSHGQDLERSDISVSDLTSALKLLPSKLLKILQ